LILALIVAAEVSTAAPQWHVDGAFPAPEAVITSVEQCGVQHAQAGFDEVLQFEAVTLPEDSVLDEPQIDCLAEVSFETGYFLIVPEAYRPALIRREQELAAPWSRELAAHHLEEMGISEPVPLRNEEETDEAFARRLELFCDAPGALTSEYGPYTIDSEWMAGRAGDFQGTGEALLCLTSAGTLSNFRIGFIGNEKLRADPAATGDR
tara:strand:+ start:220 stop:843 length:624 start_codon:yes stop_codon:yes gene_type:complete